MNWISMVKAQPPKGSRFLYWDGRDIVAAYRISLSGRIASQDYCCNRKVCTDDAWERDFGKCGRAIEESPDHFWMPLPGPPKVEE
jgi:hypothetical protein